MPFTQGKEAQTAESAESVNCQIRRVDGHAVNRSLRPRDPSRVYLADWQIRW
jgi:hypothetical protein